MRVKRGMLTKVPQAWLEAVTGGAPDAVDQPVLKQCAAEADRGVRGKLSIIPGYRNAIIRDCYNQRNRFRIGAEDVPDLLKK